MLKDSLNLVNIHVFFITLFPLFVFIGPFFENSFLFIYFIYCLYFLYIQRFNYKLDFAAILFLFYLTILISSFLSYELSSIKKSILYITYLIPIFIFYSLKFDKSIFLKVCLVFNFSIIFLSLDIIFQKLFGYNFIGFAMNECYIESLNELQHRCRPSSFFKDEIVAGSFISKFSFLPILFILSKINNIKPNYLILFTIYFFITSVAIFFTGERMALITNTSFFLVFIFLIFKLNIKLFVFIFINFLLFFFILSNINNYSSSRLNSIFNNIYTYEKISLPLLTTNFQNNETITDIMIYKDYLKDFNIKNDLLIGKLLIERKFYNEGKNYKTTYTYKDLRVRNFKYNFNDSLFYLNRNLFTQDLTSLDYYDFNLVSKKKLIKSFLDTGWGAHVQAAFNIFKNNLLIGVGLKNFQKECMNLGNLPIYEDSKKCSNHPHNYFVELMASLGILGLISFLLLFYKVILKILFSKEKIIVIIFSIITLFLIINPLLVTGSLAGSSFANKFWIQILFILFFINSLGQTNDK